MLEVAIAGVRPGVSLGEVRRELLTGNRPSNHLSLGHDGEHLYLVVWPGVLFLDIQRAIDNANLLGRGLRFEYFTNARIRTTQARLESYLQRRGFGLHQPDLVWP